ncbi:MAG: hypothetical protein L0229_27245 [Blastocatellia bacterium]|nr:hypothetical protein [Blastocatellia bacterium]
MNELFVRQRSVVAYGKRRGDTGTPGHGERVSASPTRRVSASVSEAML